MRNMPRTVAKIFALALTLITLSAAWPAYAHHLIMEDPDSSGFDNSLAIPRPEISWAVYARLEKSDDVDFIRFSIDRPEKVHLGIFIPYKPEFADYYPAYALVGPGLPIPDEKIPFALPPGYGAVVVHSPPQPTRETFFEPFTWTRLYYGVTFTDTQVSTPGVYYMAVWSDTGDYGDYLVSYGTAETWSMRDLIDAYKIVARVKAGAWGDFRGRP